MSAELHAAELNSKWIKALHKADKQERRARLYLKLAPVVVIVGFFAGIAFTLIFQACCQ